jgi:hypothetical protein
MIYLPISIRNIAIHYNYCNTILFFPRSAAVAAIYTAMALMATAMAGMATPVVAVAAMAAVTVATSAAAAAMW